MHLSNVNEILRTDFENPASHISIIPNQFKQTLTAASSITFLLCNIILALIPTRIDYENVWRQIYKLVVHQPAMSTTAQACKQNSDRCLLNLV